MTSTLAGVPVGPRYPVRIVGVINASPESFYKGSVKTTQKALAHAARALSEQGADFIDIGAMSSAPYLNTLISEEEETKRLAKAVAIIRRNTKLSISADTFRSRCAQAALNEGADIINDITGLSGDPNMAAVVKKAKSAILMAHPQWRPQKTLARPVQDTLEILKDILAAAKKAGIQKNHLILDPGIGFFRKTKFPWWQWDLEVLKNLPKIVTLGAPVLVGVSRKSFIGHLLNEKSPDKRLAGSLAATTMAVVHGASLIRTHDIQETKKAVLIAEKYRPSLH